MKTILIFTALLVSTGFREKANLVGRWETRPSEKGNVTGVVFKSDATYEGYINRKPFVSGRYTLKESLLTITENGCNGVSGIYKVILFSNLDSLRFQAVNDSCTERKTGMTRLVFGRIKRNS